MNPPEFTSRGAKNDYVQAVLTVTGIYHIELNYCHDPVAATAWLAKRWNIQYSVEQQKAILVEFTTIRLTK